MASAPRAGTGWLRLLDAWPRLRSAIYFLDGGVKMIIFCAKTCIQFQAYEIITQPVIANSLCSFRYSIYAFCFFFFKKRLRLKWVPCQGGRRPVLRHCAGRGGSFLARAPRDALAGFHRLTPTSRHRLKGAHVSEVF